MAKKQDKEGRLGYGFAAWAFLQAAKQHGFRFVRRRQQFYLFDGVRYREISDEILQAAVYRFLLRFVDERTYPKFVEETVKTIAFEEGVQIDDHTPLPSTLNGDQRSYLAVANGLLDLDALSVGAESLDDVLRPHSSDWFSVAALDYDFDLYADCPLWRRTLIEIMQGDSERIARLQEWFGYSLVAGNELKKVLLLHGESDTGKSTILNTYCDFLGEKNICCVPFEELGNRFAQAAMEGKLASVSPEIGEFSRTAEAKLKTLSGNDAVVRFERKGQDAVEGHPTCKLAFATNNLPRIIDSSGATHDRLLLIPCLRRFRGREIDRNLREKLRQELPGILNWALVGRYRLFQQGMFTPSAACDRALAEYRDETNPTERFLRSFVVADDNSALYSTDLFVRYREWMQKHGFSAKNEANFGVAVRKVFPQVQRKRDGGGMRSYCYVGVKIGAGDDPEIERQFVQPVTPPTGLLDELWERFTPQAPLLLPGPVAKPTNEREPRPRAGTDGLGYIFPTRDREFEERVQMFEEMCGLQDKLRELKREIAGLRPPKLPKPPKSQPAKSKVELDPEISSILEMIGTDEAGNVSEEPKAATPPTTTAPPGPKLSSVAENVARSIDKVLNAEKSVSGYTKVVKAAESFALDLEIEFHRPEPLPDDNDPEIRSILDVLEEHGPPKSQS